MSTLALRARLSVALSGKKFFIKIFLWFWVTVLSILAAFIVVPTLTDIHVLRPPNINAIVAPMLAAQAVHVYEAEGPSGFSRFAENMINDHGRVLFMLNSDYRDILSRPLDDEGLQVAHLAKFNELTVFRSEFAAFRYLSPSAKPYIFVLFLNPQYSRVLGRTSSAQLFDGFAIVLAVTLLCIGLARHIAAPILSLQVAARNVSEGNLRARAPEKLLKRHDEMRELAEDFNLMVSRVEGAVQSQQRLLASVSHEVRSPLTRLTVAVALLRRLEREETKTLLDRIGREVTNIDVLMGQLLTLARFQASTQPRGRIAVDLVEMLEEIVADVDFEIRGESKSVELSASPVAVESADTTILRSAIENVVRNAGRYTAQGSAVQVTVKPIGEGVAILIEDRGPGVPEEQLQAIFQPFFRVEREGGGPSGNGLGLAIAAEGIVLHGGSIQACNRAGGGLQVRIELPPGNAHALA